MAKHTYLTVLTAATDAKRHQVTVPTERGVTPELGVATEVWLPAVIGLLASNVGFLLGSPL